MGSKFQLVAVDDNPSTILDIRDAAAKQDLPEIKEAISEEEGLKLIAELRETRVPPLFIVDLKLSDDGSGFRILQAIRRRRALRFAPVVILTSTEDQETINRSYELGANSYIVKEDDPDQFAKVLDDLISFWSDSSFFDPTDSTTDEPS